MPAWNASRHIRDAIGSILAQRAAARFDIVVVDDGSTDTTREIVEEISRSVPEVRLIGQAHKGAPSARNAALDAVASDTDIVTFLDSDDLSPRGRFDRDLRTFADDEAVDVHWGMTLGFTDDDSEGPAPERRGSPERRSQLGAVMIKPAALRAIGRFDETLPTGEDVDFLLRMLETQPRLALTADVVILYRRHLTNMTRDTRLVRSALTRVYLSAAYRRRHGAPAVPPGIFLPPERPPK
jgi:glycosyltransferase involved in cell wall biosynthesis